MSQKTILTILIFVLIGLATFLGGYILVGRNNLDKTASVSQLNRFSEMGNEEAMKSNDLLTSDIANPKLIQAWKANAQKTGTLQRLSTVKAISPAISEDGRSINYFEKGTGKILKTDFPGQETKVVSGKVIEKLSNAIWSRNGFETIFNNIYLNIKTGESLKLNSNISGISWANDGKKIAYLFFDDNSGEGNISIANPDGSLFKNIFKTRSENLNLNWFKGNAISFYNPSGPDKSLFLLNTENGQLEKILDSLDNLKILWSPNGSHLFYSYRNPDGLNKASLLDLEKQISFETDLATSADKCVWTLNSLMLYCGVKKEAGEPEHLYQLDLAKKEFGLFFESSLAEPITIENPLLSPTEDLLFFVNRQDGYLYSLKL